MNEASFFLELVILLLALGVLTLMAVYGLFSLVGAVSFVPYVPSGRSKSLAMLDLAKIGEGSRIVEIGSGDGLLCLLAAERGARAVGIEINPVLVAISKMRAERWGSKIKPVFIFGDMWRYPLPPDTDTVFVYGWPDSMGKLFAKLAKELPQGTKVVSHAFLFPGREHELSAGNIRLYRI